MNEEPMNEDLETATTHPGAGPSGFGQVALEPRATGRDPSNADGGRRPCSAVTKRGTVCGRTVGTRDYGEGSRCPTHRPKLASVETPKRPKPPVSKLASLADALALASWAAIQAASGTITANQANAISSLCREFRMNFADGGVFEQTRQLLEKMEQNAHEVANDRRKLAIYKERYGDL